MIGVKQQLYYWHHFSKSKFTLIYFLILQLTLHSSIKPYTGTGCFTYQQVRHSLLTLYQCVP